MSAKPKGPRHHSCRPGTPVMVVLRDGTQIFGSFKEHSRKDCLLDDHPRIPWKLVRRFKQVPKEIPPTHQDHPNHQE